MKIELSKEQLEFIKDCLTELSGEKEEEIFNNPHLYWDETKEYVEKIDSILEYLREQEKCPTQS